MDTKTWQMLYGSVVIDISKMSATTIRLTLDVGDMRHLLKPQGQYVYITLYNCTQFEYLEYIDSSYTCLHDADKQSESLATLANRLTDLTDIAERKPQLTHVLTEQKGHKSKGNSLNIQCKYGELKLRYTSANIGVDHIKPVSEKVLVAVGKKYWRADSAMSA